PGVALHFRSQRCADAQLRQSVRTVADVGESRQYFLTRRLQFRELEFLQIEGMSLGGSGLSFGRRKQNQHRSSLPLDVTAARKGGAPLSSCSETDRSGQITS